MNTRRTQVLRPNRRANWSRWQAVILVLFGLSVLGTSLESFAQSGDPVWDSPVNLSHSQAASSPALVMQPDGGVRVFWWDQFDGVTVAERAADQEAAWEWSEPVPATLATVRALQTPTPDGQQFIRTPVTAMPHVVADQTGRAHAFWLGEADRYTGARPLLYSQISPGTLVWSVPGTLAESATTFGVGEDATGVLHLVYQRELDTALLPAGIYYRQSDNSGVSWGSASLLDASRYYRLPPAGDANLNVAADDAGTVYVTWGLPHLEQVVLAVSSDNGTTWQEPRPIGDPQGRLRHGNIIAVPGVALSLLWQDARIEGSCGLYQATVDELLAASGGVGRRVLESMVACPDLDGIQFLPLGQEQVLMVTTSGGNALILALWTGGRWSAPRRVDVQFADPQSNRRVRPSGLQVALSPVPPGEESQELVRRLIVTGLDERGEVWVTRSSGDVLELGVDLPLSTPPVVESGEGQIEPSKPANLSLSGAASNPMIVTTPDGGLRAFWWDQFDGLTTAQGVVSALTVLSGTHEVDVLREAWSEPVSMQSPATEMPHILVDEAGRVHTFWLDTGGGADQSGPGLLLYSQTVPGWSHLSQGLGQAWFTPTIMAESVINFAVAYDPQGVLHLAYLRRSHTSDAPAGLYHRSSQDAGAIWGDAQMIHGSRYYRLLQPADAHLDMVTDGGGGLYVTWAAPRVGEVLLSSSDDGGATWEPPTLVGDPDGQPRRGRFITAVGETADGLGLLWEDTSTGGQCALYQAAVADLFAEHAEAGERVLEGLVQCPDPGGTKFLPVGDDRVLMVAGGGSNALDLAVWNGEQWSESRRLSYPLEDLQMGAQVFLDGLQAVVVRGSAASEGGDDWALVVVGTDKQGDVWTIPSDMSTLQVVFAPPSPWSAVMAFPPSETLPSLPAMTVDQEGRVHALWVEPESTGQSETSLYYARWDGSTSDSGQWTRAERIFGTVEEGATQPALVAVGERLQAVWSAGPNGEILYSHAFLRDAYVASGWKEPEPLPAPAAVGSWPDLAADAAGNLHVVYAVPVNEGRGVYYTGSEDEGENWLPARQIFDAAAEGWAVVDYPRLAVDGEGILHVVWVRAALAKGGLSEGIYYARSRDGGETWSEPLQVAEGAYNWPQVATGATGEVHLLWNEASDGQALWHQWSEDGGQMWMRAARVRGFVDVPGPAGLVADGAQTLHLVGLGRDEGGELALLYATWGGSAELSTGANRWSEPEALRLDLEVGGPGVAVALLPTIGRLDAVLRGQPKANADGGVADLWYASRLIPTVVVTPPPTATPRPAATPLPPTTPMPTPTPTPDLSVGPPPAQEDSESFVMTLVLGGGLAAVIVVGIFGVYLWARRR